MYVMKLTHEVYEQPLCIVGTAWTNNISLVNPKDPSYMVFVIYSNCQSWLFPSFPEIIGDLFINYILFSFNPPFLINNKV